MATPAVPLGGTVTLFCRNGVEQPFRSAQYAMRALGRSFIANKVGRDFQVHAGFASDDLGRRVAFYRTYDFVLRDASGRALTISDFPAVPASRLWGLRYSEAPWSGVGAVPGTGRHRRGRTCRRMRTTQERRQSQEWQLEPQAPKPRASRNVSRLPDAWDEVYRSSLRDHCWKRHRRTQYHSQGRTRPTRAGRAQASFMGPDD